MWRFGGTLQMQNKICTVHNNLYLRKLLDFKIYLDMKPSGTMAYLFSKRFSVGPWGRVLKEGGTEVHGVDQAKLWRSWDIFSKSNQ